MAYIGNDPSNRFVAPKAASVFSGDGSTTAFTLDHAVGSDEDILVSVDGVIQEPSVAYAVSNGTTLTFTGAPSSNSGNNIFVYYLFRTVGTVSHPSNNALEATSATFSGDVTIPDKIIHSGDTNTAIRFPAADTVTFETSGTERGRFNSGGSLFLGNTAEFVDGTASTDIGIEAKGIGLLMITRNQGVPTIFGRQDTDGQVIQLRKNGASHGGLEVASSGSTLDVFLGNGSRGLKFRATSVIPRAVSDGAANDVMDLGSSASKFDDVFATNGTIQTSDKNEKQDIEELSDAEKRVAVVAKGLMRKYRWKSKVAEKGDKARTHFGIIAQDLEDAFKAEGLDASKYAMFCSDTWWEKEEKYTDDDGKEQTRIMDYEKEEDAPKDATKITRLGVRYTELLAFIISAI